MNRLETTNFTMRLPVTLHNELRITAEANGRTITGEVIHRLQMASVEERLAALEARFLPPPSKQKSAYYWLAHQPIGSIP